MNWFSVALFAVQTAVSIASRRRQYEYQKRSYELQRQQLIHQQNRAKQEALDKELERREIRDLQESQNRVKKAFMGISYDSRSFLAIKDKNDEMMNRDLGKIDRSLSDLLFQNQIRLGNVEIGSRAAKDAFIYGSLGDILEGGRGIYKEWNTSTDTEDTEQPTEGSPEDPESDTNKKESFYSKEIYGADWGRVNSLSRTTQSWGWK
tara:strand:+ start:231 stop:848 length:618 start_codon:yes stop_codon:yes gene_type:complete